MDLEDVIRAQRRKNFRRLPCCVAASHPFARSRRKDGSPGSSLPYWDRLKTAPTVSLFVIVTEQVHDVTYASLLQVFGSGPTGAQLAENPPNIDPVAGLAIRVTGVFST